MDRQGDALSGPLKESGWAPCAAFTAACFLRWAVLEWGGRLLGTLGGGGGILEAGSICSLLHAYRLPYSSMINGSDKQALSVKRSQALRIRRAFGLLGSGCICQSCKRWLRGSRTNTPSSLISFSFITTGTVSAGQVMGNTVRAFGPAQIASQRRCRIVDHWRGGKSAPRSNLWVSLKSAAG